MEDAQDDQGQDEGAGGEGPHKDAYQDGGEADHQAHEDRHLDVAEAEGAATDDVHDARDYEGGGAPAEDLHHGAVGPGPGEGGGQEDGGVDDAVGYEAALQVGEGEGEEDGGE